MTDEQHPDLGRLGPLRGVAEALSLFTILPGPYLNDIDRPLARRAITAFPWLGLCPVSYTHLTLPTTPYV